MEESSGGRTLSMQPMQPANLSVLETTEQWETVSRMTQRRLQTYSTLYVNVALSVRLTRSHFYIDSMRAARSSSLMLAYM